MTLAVPQGSGHSARRVGSAGRLPWGLVAAGTLLLAWGAPELMSWWVRYAVERANDDDHEDQLPQGGPQPLLTAVCARD